MSTNFTPPDPQKPIPPTSDPLDALLTTPSFASSPDTSALDSLLTTGPAQADPNTGIKPSNRFGASRPSHIHAGTDFGGSLNSPVGSADDGEVIFAGPDGNKMGNAVKVRHADGTVSVYGHLNKVGVGIGDTVSRGDSIGLLGQTGNAKGPHVHFEVRKGGVNAVDPMLTSYRPLIGAQAKPRTDPLDALLTTGASSADPLDDLLTGQKPAAPELLSTTTPSVATQPLTRREIAQQEMAKANPLPQNRANRQSQMMMLAGRGYQEVPYDPNHPDEGPTQAMLRLEMNAINRGNQGDPLQHAAAIRDEFGDPTAAQMPVSAATKTPLYGQGYGAEYTKGPLDPGYVPPPLAIQQQPTNIVDQMNAQYPVLKQQGLQFHNSIGAAKDWKGNPVAGRKLEFYAPNEPDNPNPGKPTVEQFDPNMSSKDALGEMFSHYLPSVDPAFAEGRRQFINSIDANQREMLSGDYQDQVKNKVFGDNPPSFPEWIQNQGGDAFFRGYIADQYPKDSYRPDQVALLSGLQQRLTAAEKAEAPGGGMEFGGMSPQEKSAYAQAQNAPNAIDRFSQLAVASMANQRRQVTNTRRAQAQNAIAKSVASTVKAEGDGRYSFIDPRTKQIVYANDRNQVNQILKQRGYRVAVPAPKIGTPEALAEAGGFSPDQITSTPEEVAQTIAQENVATGHSQGSVRMAEAQEPRQPVNLAELSARDAPAVKAILAAQQVSPDEAAAIKTEIQGRLMQNIADPSKMSPADRAGLNAEAEQRAQSQIADLNQQRTQAWLAGARQSAIDPKVAVATLSNVMDQVPTGNPLRLLPDDARKWAESWTASVGADWLGKAAFLIRTGMPAIAVAHAFGAPDTVVDHAADFLRTTSNNIHDIAAAADRSSNRTEGSQFALDIAKGFGGSAPELTLMALGVPAAVAFGLGGAAQAQNQYATLGQTIGAATKQAAIGALFDMPLPEKLAMIEGIRGNLIRAGIRMPAVGAGTFGIEKVSGTPTPQALQSAATNALLAGTGEAAGILKAGARRGAEEIIRNPNSPEFARNIVKEAAGFTQPAVATEYAAPENADQALVKYGENPVRPRRAMSVYRNPATGEVVGHEIDLATAEKYHNAAPDRSDLVTIDGKPYVRSPQGLTPADAARLRNEGQNPNEYQRVYDPDGKPYLIHQSEIASPRKSYALTPEQYENLLDLVGKGKGGAASAEPSDAKQLEAPTPMLAEKGVPREMARSEEEMTAPERAQAARTREERAPEAEAIEAPGEAAAPVLRALQRAHQAGDRPSIEALTKLASERGATQADIESTKPTITPPTAETPRVPERAETVQSQLDALTEGRGSRKAVIIPEGHDLPAVPEGMEAHVADDGSTFIYDPKKTSPAEIDKAVETNSTNKLIGAVEPGGPKTDQVVVARAPDGTEKQAVYVSPEKVPDQISEFQQQHPGATIEVGGKSVEGKVLADRQAGIESGATAPPAEPKGSQMTESAAPIAPAKPQEAAGVASMPEQFAYYGEVLDYVDSLPKSEQVAYQTAAEKALGSDDYSAYDAMQFANRYFRSSAQPSGVASELAPMSESLSTRSTPQRSVEMMRVSDLDKFADRQSIPNSSGENARLKDQIQKEGITEPLILSYDPNTKRSYLSEGNNRLAIAKELGIKELPVRVLRSDATPSKGTQVSGYSEQGHVPSEMPPSQIGVPSRTQSNAGRSAPNENEVGTASEVAPRPEMATTLKGTKAVDAQGSPVRVYHGTHERVDEFDSKQAGSRMGYRYEGGPAFFFTDSRENANQYAYAHPDVHPYARPNVVPAYLNLKNPLVVDAENPAFTTMADAIKTARRGGNDGVVVKNFKDSPSWRLAEKQTTYVAFDPEQIVNALSPKAKSAQPAPPVPLGKPSDAPTSDEWKAVAEDLADVGGVRVVQKLYEAMPELVNRILVGEGSPQDIARFNDAASRLELSTEDREAILDQAQQREPSREPHLALAQILRSLFGAPVIPITKGEKGAPRLTVDGNRVYINNAMADALSLAVKGRFGVHGMHIGNFDDLNFLRRGVASASTNHPETKEYGARLLKVARKQWVRFGSVNIATPERMRHEVGHEAFSALVDPRDAARLASYLSRPTLAFSEGWSMLPSSAREELLKLGYLDHPLTLVNEALAFIFEGRATQLGLTEDAAVRWVRVVVDTAVKRNLIDPNKPERVFDKTKEGSYEIQQAIRQSLGARVYARENAPKVPSYSERGRSVSSRRGSRPSFALEKTGDRSPASIALSDLEDEIRRPKHLLFAALYRARKHEYPIRAPVTKTQPAGTGPEPAPPPFNPWEEARVGDFTEHEGKIVEVAGRDLREPKAKEVAARTGGEVIPEPQNAKRFAVVKGTEYEKPVDSGTGTRGAGGSVATRETGQRKLDEITDKPGSVHKLSNTQVNLPSAIAKKILAAGEKLIPDAELYTDPDDPSFGREELAHVTIKYGLWTPNANDARPVLEDEPPISLTFGEISIFPASEGSPFDVVKIGIKSDDLHRLNKKISESLQVTDTHPRYVAHATIAYVQPGKGEQYVGKSLDGVTGKSVTIGSVFFSGKNGEDADIPLGGAESTAEGFSLTEIKRRLPVGFDKDTVRIVDGRILATEKPEYGGREMWVSLKRATATPVKPKEKAHATDQQLETKGSERKHPRTSSGSAVPENRSEVRIGHGKQASGRDRAEPGQEENAQVEAANEPGLVVRQWSAGEAQKQGMTLAGETYGDYFLFRGEQFSGERGWLALNKTTDELIRDRTVKDKVAAKQEVERFQSERDELNARRQPTQREPERGTWAPGEEPAAKETGTAEAQEKTSLASDFQQTPEGSLNVPEVAPREGEEDLSAIFRGLFKPAKPAPVKSAGSPANALPSGAVSTAPMPLPSDMAGKNLWLQDWNARFKEAVAPENPDIDALRALHDEAVEFRQKARVSGNEVLNKKIAGLAAVAGEVPNYAQEGSESDTEDIPSFAAVNGVEVSLGSGNFGRQLLFDALRTQGYDPRGHLLGIYIRGSAASLASALDHLGREKREGAFELAAAVREAAKVDQGRITLYSSATSRLHELFHYGADLASGGDKFLAERHAPKGFERLTAGPTWIGIASGLTARGYAGDLPYLVEEGAAALASGEDLGLAPDRQDDWMAAWYRSFIAAGGNIGVKDFKELSDEAARIRATAESNTPPHGQRGPDGRLQSLPDRRQGRPKEISSKPASEIPSGTDQAKTASIRRSSGIAEPLTSERRSGREPDNRGVQREENGVASGATAKGGRIEPRSDISAERLEREAILSSYGSDTEDSIYKRVRPLFVQALKAVDRTDLTPGETLKGLVRSLRTYEGMKDEQMIPLEPQFLRFMDDLPPFTPRAAGKPKPPIPGKQSRIFQTRTEFVGEQMRSLPPGADPEIALSRARSAHAYAVKKAAAPRKNNTPSKYQEMVAFGEITPEHAVAILKSLGENVPTHVKREIAFLQGKAHDVIGKKMVGRVGRPKSDPSLNSESVEVRAQGGIRTDPDGDNAGEIQHLKESGPRGLVDEKNGQTAEGMAITLAQEGYGLGRWSGLETGNGIDAGIFLESLTEDAAGSTKHYSTAYNPEIEGNPDDQAFSADIAELARVAREHGLSDEGLQAFLRAVDSESKADLPEESQASETDPDSEGYSLDDSGTLLDPNGEPLFARYSNPEQLGFVNEGLTMQEAPRALSNDRERLQREEKDRQEAANPERAAALRTLAEIRRRGFTVDEYARQGALFGERPSDSEIKLLKELEHSTKAKPVDTQGAMFAKDEGGISTTDKPQFTVENGKIILQNRTAAEMVGLAMGRDQIGGMFVEHPTRTVVASVLYSGLGRIAQSKSEFRVRAYQMAEAVSNLFNAGHRSIRIALSDRMLHETSHKASYDASTERAVADRHTAKGLTEITALPEWPVIEKGLTRFGYGGETLPTRIEEAYSLITEGRYGDLGLTEAQGDKFLDAWFTSFAEAGGDISEKHWKETTDEINAIRQRVYERTATADASRSPQVVAGVQGLERGRQGSDESGTESPGTGEKPKFARGREGAGGITRGTRTSPSDISKGRPTELRPVRDAQHLREGRGANESKEVSTSQAERGRGSSERVGGISQERTVTPLPPAARQTDTPEFKRWFKNSAVIDSDGQPLVVYHGTGQDFSEFDPAKVGTNAGVDEKGFFFTDDPDLARRGWGTNVIAAFLSLQKPKVIEESTDPIQHWDDNSTSILHEIAVEGAGDLYDGVVIKSAGESGSLYVAFEPRQIKSASTNVGTFDSSNPNILMAREKPSGSSGPNEGLPVNATADQSDLDRVSGGTESLSDLPQTKTLREKSLRGFNIPRNAKEGDSVTPQTLHGDTTGSEAGVNSGSTDAEMFSNLIVSLPFKDHGLGGFDVPTQRMVMSRVLAMAHDPEIRRDVVPLDLVNVMDILGGVKRPPQVLLHDKSVLLDPLTVNPNGSISLRGDVADSLVVAIANVVAKRPDRPDLSRVAIKDISTLGARDLKHGGTLASRGNAEQDKSVLFARKEDELNPLDELRRLADESSGPEGEWPVGIKNAQTNREREDLGLDPISIEARKIIPMFDAVRQDFSPEDSHDLALEIAEHPRNLSAEETAQMIMYKAWLKNQYAEALKNLQRAREDEEGEGRARIRLAALDEQMLTYHHMGRLSGYEWGLTGRLRQEMMLADYSLAEIKARAGALMGLEKGETIPADLEQRLADLVKERDDALQALKEYDEKASVEAAKQALAHDLKLRREAERRAKQSLQHGDVRRERTVRRVATKAKLDEDFASLAEKYAMKLASSEFFSNPFLMDPELLGILKQMFENRLEAGANTIEDTIGKIWGEIKQVGVPKDATERDLRDAISGYGKTIKMSKEEIDVRRRELRALARDISALQDIEGGQRPARSGLQRDKQTQRLRESKKRIQAALRQYNIQVEQSERSPEELQQSALDSMKTRLRNRIEDLKSYIAGGERAPKRPGVQPDPEAQALITERDRLQKILDDIEGPSKLTDDEKIELATAAVERSIADYEKRIAEGDVLVKRKAVEPWSRELGRLKQRQTELREQVATARKNHQTTQAEAAERSLRTLKASIDRLEKRVATGDLSTRPKATSTVTSPEIKAAKAHRKALQGILAQMRADAKPKKTDAEKFASRVVALHKRVDKRLDQLNEMLRTGNFAKKPKAMPIRDPQLDAKRAEIKRAEGKIDLELKKIDLANRTKVRKFWTHAVGLRRMVGLSSTFVIGKLTAAANARIFFSIGEEIAGAPFPYLPIIGTFARQAPSEGYLNLEAEWNHIAAAYSLAMTKQFMKVLRTGKMDIDVLHGKKDEYEMPHMWYEWVGHLHAALKTPAKMAAFERYIAKNLAWLQRHGYDPTDEGMKALAAGRAVIDANRQILQQDNIVSELFKRILRTLEEKKYKAGSPQAADLKKAQEQKHPAIATLLKLMFFVTKVPPNFLWEAVQYTPLQLALTAWRIQKALRTHGFGETGGAPWSGGGGDGQEPPRSLPPSGNPFDDGSGTPPDEADAIIRGIKKGAFGSGWMALAALAAFGLIHFIEFGGYWHRGEKRKKEDVPAGGIRILGFNLPSWATHVPLLESMQAVYDAIKVANAFHSEGHGIPGSIAHGVWSASTGMLEELPFYEEPVRATEAMRNVDTWTEYLAGIARGFVVPPDTTRAAKTWDPSEPTTKMQKLGEMTGFRRQQPAKRKPEPGSSIPKIALQTVELGIPGLRKKVPANTEANRTDLKQEFTSQIRQLKSIIGERFEKLTIGRKEEEEQVWNSLTPAQRDLWNKNIKQITKATEEGKLKPADAPEIASAAQLTPLQKEFSRKDLKTALALYESYSPEKRAEVRDILINKGPDIKKMYVTEQDAAKKRFTRLIGEEPKTSKPDTPSWWKLMEQVGQPVHP